MIARVIGCAALLLFLVVFAGADVFTLENGDRIEGSVLKETATEITVRSYDKGDVTILTSSIKKRQKRRSLIEEYEKRVGKAEETAKAHFALGKWCQNRKLTFWAKKEFEKALELDPDHASAKKALGREGNRKTTAQKSMKGRPKRDNIVEMKLKVAVKADAPPEWYDGFKKHITAALEKIWETT